MSNETGGQREASPLKMREVARLDKFEMEENGRRLIESITLVDGVIVSVERPPS